MRKAANWTEDEKKFLSENWGSLSIDAIMKKLNRSRNAINIMVQRMGLGPFLINGDYVTWNQLLVTLGYAHQGNSYKNVSWIQKRNFPIHTKRVGTNSYKIVYLNEFWDWAEKNRDLLDFSNFEENTLGEEPEWAKQKRKLDFEKNRKYKTTPWTKLEDDKLLRLLQKQQYTYNDLSKMLNRTNGAIQRRVCDLGYKERPVKAPNHTKWTESDFSLLEKLIKEGFSYELMAEELGKSSKAIRGRVYVMYLTENLDKVREIMGNGHWGDNRPERSIKQWNVMDTAERNEARQELTSFVSVLRCLYRQAFDDSDFWQKDICQHWNNFCTKNQTNCDECVEFERIKPQYCKRCGKTFFERKNNLYCSDCRNARRRQYLHKKMALSGK